MPKKYMLEIVAGSANSTPIVYHSTQPFGSVSKGDRITLIGDGGKLVTKNVGGVEHTIWMEGRTAVHKLQVTTA